jgi:hypothetical protein
MVLITILLVTATLAAAQHHGGHGMGGGIAGNSGGRPTGIDEKDSLKDFHQALAVQASEQQIAEFQQVVRSANVAVDRVLLFQKQAAAPGREGVTSLDQAVENARVRNKQFLSGFSEAQKSGLKETVKRVEKSDADLDQEEKRLDQSLEAEFVGSEVASRAESLHKALAAFSDSQLSLGREMGINLASEQDVTFTLPIVRTPVRLGRRNIQIDTAGDLTQTGVAGDLRTFQLEESADLSDLQQNLAEVMSAQLASSKTCGDHLSVKRAVLMVAAPASTLELLLHFERWSCTRMPGQVSEELGEGDGTVELQLLPTIEGNSLHFTAKFKRIDASGMMGQELRSGDAGDELREQAAKTILTATLAATDLKKTLPLALQNGAAIQTAKFQSFGTGGVELLEEGPVTLSNAQVAALAAQLNQVPAAPGAATR